MFNVTRSVYERSLSDCSDEAHVLVRGLSNGGWFDFAPEERAVVFTRENVERLAAEVERCPPAAKGGKRAVQQREHLARILAVVLADPSLMLVMTAY